MTGPVEIEVKLSIEAHDVAALRAHPLIAAHALGPALVRRIDNRYFDTPDRALAAAGMGLRLRRIGRRWFQTLKAGAPGSGALSTRTEWEQPVTGARLELARLRATPLMQIAGPARLARLLEPVFAIDFRRETWDLRLSDGTRAELALDLGSIRTGRGRSACRAPISEIELELVAGDPAALLAFAYRLARDIALIPQPDSKAARGHALADAHPPEPVKVRAVAMAPDRPAGAALAAHLAAGAHSLLVNARGIDAPGADPEFVHQARVAVRRMRCALRMHRALFARRRSDALDEQLRSIGTVLGTARDWDVFCTSTIDRLAKLMHGEAALQEALPDLRATASRQRAEAARQVRALVHAREFGRALIALERFEMRLASRTAPDATQAATQLLRRQHARIRKFALALADLDEARRHRMRIAVKRQRYTLDQYAGLFAAGELAPYQRALTGLQDELGALNDLAVASRLIRATGSGSLAIAKRFDAWRAEHVRAMLPGIAAHAKALELALRPWEHAPRADEARRPGRLSTTPAD